MKRDARTMLPPAATHISAQNAVATPTLRASAKLRRENEDTPLSSFWNVRPRYARDLMWSKDEPEHPSTAQMSVTLPPVPFPPPCEVGDQTAQLTLQRFSQLFDIVTPIRIHTFSTLLRSHPNRPFVASVLRSLKEGFWPWADTVSSGRPPIVDNSPREIKDPSHLAFVREQRDEEVRLRRFSPAFDALQPGMTCVPLWVVPKPHSEKLRLVVDHTAGPHSPNSYIPLDGGQVHLDTLHQLGAALLKARRRHGPDSRLVLFKSDVSQAYRRLPVHPLWQLHQIVHIDGHFHVDRNNDFGNRAAGRVWFTFFSLVAWIAVFVAQIPDLFTYVDDSFSWELADNVTFYPRYNKQLPSKQARFLCLLDAIGIPHEERKQVFGSRLDIIGLTVDTDAMSIEMSSESRTLLVEAIHAFATPRQRRNLRDCQRLAGWINWALNAYPLLRPGLSALYDKMRRGTHAYTVLTLNVSIIRELRWIARHLDDSPGICIMTSQTWDPDEADLTLLSDACPSGMGFWSPKTCEGFQCVVPPSSCQPIFYLEALAVLSAFHHVCMTVRPAPARVALFTDNMNTVNMFNTLSALPAYNPIALTAAEWLLKTGIQLRVFHLPRRFNEVADALSRFENIKARSLEPSLSIGPFTPPRFTLGESGL